MKIKTLIRASIFGGVMALLPFQVPAQTHPEVPYFYPATHWEVVPTVLNDARGLSGVKLPCLMKTRFDNGYVMRLSGAQGKMMAMAIDFRQNVFTRGKKYGVSLNVNLKGKQKFQATAFSESVLVFNLRSVKNLYSQMQDADYVDVQVEGNEFRFNLGNIDDGFKRIEKCYNGEVDNRVAEIQTREGSALPVMPESPAIQQEAGLSEMPMDIRPNASIATPPAPVPAMSDMPQTGGQQWVAHAGDNVKKTLERWAGQADVNLDWQAADDSTVATDMTFSGSFEEAVQMLMAQNAMARDYSAELDGRALTSIGGSSDSRILMPSKVSQKAEVPYTPAPAKTSLSRSGGAKWFAPAGASLQQVLKKWSQTAGVEVLWESGQSFAVKGSVQESGSYEAALQALLDQFAADDLRPIVQLNTDPNTGRRVLLVESSYVL